MPLTDAKPIAKAMARAVPKQNGDIHLENRLLFPIFRPAGPQSPSVRKTRALSWAEMLTLGHFNRCWTLGFVAARAVYSRDVVTNENRKIVILLS